MEVTALSLLHRERIYVRHHRDIGAVLGHHPIRIQVLYWSSHRGKFAPPLLRLVRMLMRIYCSECWLLIPNIISRVFAVT
jgi:hypothetical protein